MRVVALLSVLLFISSCSAYTSLQHYVNFDDGFYSWNTTGDVIEKNTYYLHNVYLTSQKWLTKGEVAEGGEIWHHWVQLVVPKEVIDTDMAFLYINGGSNKRFDQVPTSVDAIVSSFAVATGTIGVNLGQIPNESLKFVGEKPQKSRTEDAMIAYTWSHWINNTLEYDWLARMPMTKAAIKAMDAVQEYAKQTDGVYEVERFVVGGASKRGWTTWMVGSMNDDRVVGIVPIVAPIANLVPQINEMWMSYGEWSFALQDYVDMDLMGWLNLPPFTEMLNIIDPLLYPTEIARLPKYAICACGDEFFMPDSAQYYWDQLGGQKQLYMVPNAEHSLAGHAYDVVGAAEQWYLLILNEQEDLIPEYDWEISPDGNTITLTTQQTEYITDAKVYYSLNNHKRDWRLIVCSDPDLDCVNPALFRHETLDAVAPGVYTYTIPEPATGNYSAFLIEVNYDFQFPNLSGSARKPMHITSDMSISPRGVYPYDHCPDDVCKCGYDCANNYFE